MYLKELRSCWEKNAFRPNKRLGQNFLIDKNIRNKILTNMECDKNGTLLEIGPGFGAMTFEFAKHFKKVVAVEKDAKIFSIMKPVCDDKNITLINDDILDFDIKKIASEKNRITVSGNIPYYISAPLIEKIIANRQVIKNAYIVMQEEVVDRVIARAGSKTYSSLSCFVKYFTEADKLFRIKKNSFYPSPRVFSALLRMKILKEPSVKVKNEELMFRIIRKAFSQRRKKAVNPLSDKNFLGINKEKWGKIFKACDLSPCLRAEQITLSGYARITDKVSNIMV